MTFFAQVFVVMMAVLLAVSNVEQVPLNSGCQLVRPTCGNCGSPVNVTLIVRNILKPPNFELVTTAVINQGTLLNVLQEAANRDSSFRFTVAYMSNLGFYMVSINDLEASAENRTYWSIISQGTGALKCDVSWYIPTDGETILFNFTVYEALHYVFS